MMCLNVAGIRSILIVCCRILAVPIAVWGVVDFGSGTLVDLIRDCLGASLAAAGILSAAMAGLGVVSLFPVRRKRDEKSESCERE